MAGYGASSYETGGAPLVTAGVEWEGERWTEGVGILAGVGTQVTADLETTDADFGVNLELLRNWHFSLGQLRLGPTISILLLEQSTQDRSPLFSPGAVVAARAQFEIPLSSNVGLVLGTDLGALVTHLSSTPATLGATLGPVGIAASVSGTLGVRLAL